MSRFTSLLTAAVVSCSLLLTFDGVASAKGHGGGGGHGGGHGGGGHYSGGGGHYSGGGGHYSGGGGHYYGGGGHYYGHDGYRHDGFLGGVFLGGYPGYYGGYYGGYPSYSGYYDDSYSYPDTVIESPPVESYYEPQAAPSIQSTAATSIRVIKPSPNAVLWMDGRRADGATDTHIFEFSNEASGQMYTHKIACTWMRDGKPVREERQVQLAGGQSAVVDFNRPAPAAPPVK